MRPLWRAALLAVACIGTASAEEAECPNPVFLVGQAEREVMDFYLADAQRTLLDATRAMGCAPLIEPALAGRMWLLEGVRMSVSDEDPTLAFRSAARAAPDHWNPNYGVDMRSRYDEALAAPAPDPGILAVRGVARRERVAVDGTLLESLPAELPAGHYLVQVGALPERAREARMIIVPPGGQVTANFTYVPSGTDDGAVATRRPATAPLAVGIGLLGLSAGSGALAAHSKSRFMDTPVEDDARSWFTLNRASLGAAGTFAVAGTALTATALFGGTW